MKKKVLFIFLSVLILSTLIASAANETQVDAKAYACLENKVKDKCSSLSTEEKIFSLLAIGQCRAELMTDSLDSECWPNNGCKIKTTAQAILALSHSNSDTLSAEQWLLSQSVRFEDIDWLLQTESLSASLCTVTYSTGTYQFSVNEDKSLTGGVGSCLSVYNDYWLRIAPACYDEEFQISCDESFLTSLLYKRRNSPVVYVSEKTSSAAAQGTTTEEVTSSCFKEGNSCSYEGTLWAAIVLKYKKYDVSAYIPYLVALADENTKYLPEAFLYSMTNNFKIDLLSKQKEGQYWSESGDRFYDTAVALLPFQGEDFAEKTSSKNWLAGLQGSDGCWQGGNIRNTAFLLYSIWPKKITSFGGLADEDDCQESNFYCMSSAACLDNAGKILDGFSGCFGTNICCDKQQKVETCQEQNGELCDSTEECIGGTKVASSDSTPSNFCCVNGVCEPKQAASECENAGATCKASCSSNEKLSPYACPSSRVCCSQKTGGTLWIIILLTVLIILTILGIIFRKQLRELFFRIKSQLMQKKTKPAPSKNLPTTPSARVYPGAVQRRVAPPQTRPPAQKPAPKSDFDDVLKKLKDIGK